MNKAVAVVSLCITGGYLYSILAHMIRPGESTGYTRMLMFACLATIPLAFLMAILGARDLRPFIASIAGEEAGSGPLSIPIPVGLVVVLVVMSLGMLLAIWSGVGLRFGLLFIVFFVPLILRLVTSPARASIETAIIQVVLLFAGLFIGVGIVFFLGVSASETYQRHLQVIWPGYEDAAKVFFGVCVFAFLNQILEFSRAIIVLLKKG